MFRQIMLAAATTALLAGTADADPIEGNWKTQSGETAAIGACGGAFCITLQTGDHAGKQIGQVSPSGEGRYAGKITDPANDKTYSGKASIDGGSMKMSGCVLGGLICQSQTWTKM
jgi:uncharacterized protein (DUF2147 family)